MVTVKTKIWVSTGVFILSGMQIDLSSQAGSAPGIHYSSASAADTSSDGGEGGEGGESGEKTLTPSERKTETLKNMALVEGHLIVGVELYRLGAYEAAQSHMKHPKDELYRDIQSGLKQFRAAGFEESLTRLSTAVEAKQPIASIDEAFKKVMADIDAARAKAYPSAKMRMLVISQVIRTAADEYSAGVKDGKVVDAHEYQDAYGFFMAAKNRLAKIETDGSTSKATIAQAKQILDEQQDSWQSLTSETAGKPNATSLYSAASKIELAASSL